MSIDNFGELVRGLMQQRRAEQIAILEKALGKKTATQILNRKDLREDILAVIISDGKDNEAVSRIKASARERAKRIINRGDCLLLSSRCDVHQLPS